MKVQRVSVNIRYLEYNPLHNNILSVKLFIFPTLYFSFILGYTHAPTQMNLINKRSSFKISKLLNHTHKY